MYECKNLDEAIWLRLNEIELNVVNENGRVTFIADDEGEEFNNVIMDYLAAKDGYRDITCSYTRLLRAIRWCKNKIHANK